MLLVGHYCRGLHDEIRPPARGIQASEKMAWSYVCEGNQVTVGICCGDVANAEHFTVPSQRMVPYPITKSNERALEVVLKQPAQYASTYRLLEEIRSVEKRKESYEVRIR